MWEWEITRTPDSSSGLYRKVNEEVKPLWSDLRETDQELNDQIRNLRSQAGLRLRDSLMQFAANVADELPRIINRDLGIPFDIDTGHFLTINGEPMEDGVYEGLLWYENRQRIIQNARDALVESRRCGTTRRRSHS